MKTITWNSQFDFYSTYGVISTRMCEELLKLGVDVRLDPWKESSYFSPELEKIKHKKPEGIKIRMSGIDSISGFDDYNFIPDYVPSYQSAYFDEEMAQLSKAKRLIIPSIFQKAAFDSLALKAKVVPRGSDFKPILRIRRKADIYTFLFIGYLSEYKGLHYLAKAFSKAFSKKEKVKLILKGNSMDTHPNQMTNKEIESLFKNPKMQIKIIKENWQLPKLQNLYRDSDCFVSPHCSLGMFGTRVALDARKTSLPLIAPRFGEVQNWGDERFLIDYELCDNGIKPNLDQFAKSLRMCYYNKVSSVPIDPDEWTWEKSANKFLKILNEDFNLGR